MGRVVASEVFDLTFEVAFLFLATDTGVANSSLLRLDTLNSKDSGNVVTSIESLLADGSNRGEFSVIGPAFKSGVGDSILISEFLGCDILFI